MRNISIAELKNRENKIILDIRKREDFNRGSMQEAINIPSEEIGSAYESLDKEKDIYVLCYTGERSTDAVEFLEDKGYSVYNIEGGYRSFLRETLEEMVRDEENIKQRTAQIENSIIKKFRKPIWRQFTKGINDYQLVLPGDKIAVCISGGKDSMLMAKLLQELKKHGKVPFELVFLIMNPGYREDNWQIILNNARILGIELTVFNTDIFDTVEDIDRNPCYLCARMRRGYLYSKAKELGCNKIALGHHFDDVIETTLMGMLYSGKIETMMPKLHSQNFAGMELIRPMYLIREEAIKAWRDYNHLGFIQCACRFTENCVSCGGGRGSKRDEMKELIAGFRETSDVIDMNIFRSVHNINLRTVIGYHKDDMTYNFLDDYEKYAKKEE
ncbi:MAG: ATPase [Lachnospiraceae bacterium]|nr:ATPase [Lachnospiraceae bacterium]MDY6221763.1 ATP-binding protein [Candidatus Alectryocaccobium sp.]